MRAAADWCCRNVLKFVGYLVGLGVFVRVLGYFWIFCWAARVQLFVGFGVGSVFCWVVLLLRWVDDVRTRHQHLLRWGFGFR